jgi:hypothetical protein
MLVVTVFVLYAVETTADWRTVVLAPEVMVAPIGHVVMVCSTMTVVRTAAGAVGLWAGGDVGAIGMLDGQLVMMPGLLGI